MSRRTLRSQSCRASVAAFWRAGASCSAPIPPIDAYMTPIVACTTMQTSIWARRHGRKARCTCTPAVSRRSCKPERALRQLRRGRAQRSWKGIRLYGGVRDIIELNRYKYCGCQGWSVYICTPLLVVGSQYPLHLVVLWQSRGQIGCILDGMHRASRVSCLVPAVFAPFWVYGQASCETGSEAVARKGTLIVKFGGSAITEKAVFESLKRDVLLSSARGVQRAFDSGIWDRIVVVHGAGKIQVSPQVLQRPVLICHTAGSFGHFQAKQHALKNGRSSQSDDSTPSLTSWRTGLSLTRQSVQKLNLEVLAAHVATGLPAVAVSPFPTAITGHVANSVQPHINPNRSAVKQPGVLNHLLDLADSGLVPIIHGDIVLDDSQTCAVLGGDHIISWYGTVSTSFLSWLRVPLQRYESLTHCLPQAVP